MSKTGADGRPMKRTWRMDEGTVQAAVAHEVPAAHALDPFCPARETPMDGLINSMKRMKTLPQLDRSDA